MSEQVRIHPKAVEHEASILGEALYNHTFAEKIVAQLETDAFYTESHQKIFEAIKSLLAKGKLSTLQDVVQELDQQGNLEAIGGPYTLSQLESVSDVVAENHLQTVLESWTYRKIIQLGRDVTDTAFKQSDRPDQLINWTIQKFEDRLQYFHRFHRRITTRLIGADLPDSETISHNEQGASTRIEDLDKVLTLHQNNYIIVTGYSGHGKSTLAHNILKNRALVNEPVAVFSLEMARPQLQRIYLSMLSGVQILDRRTPQTKDEKNKIELARQKLAGMPIYLNDDPALTVADLRANLRTLTQEHGVKRVLVDYIQLMNHPDRDERRIQLEEISRNLKLISKEFDITLIAISNLSKPTGYVSEKKPPTAQQMKGSSNFVYDADIVLVVHNLNKAGIEDAEEGETLVKAVKKRYGAEASKTLRFLGWRYTFGNMDFRAEPF